MVKKASKFLLCSLSVSAMLFTNQLAACDYAKERWHDPFAADVQEHHSPDPPNNVVEPYPEAAEEREIEDTFGQEDNSTIDDEGEEGGVDAEKVDKPFEDRLDELVDSDHNKYHTYHRRSAFTRRPLKKKDVMDGGKAHGFYSIKNTAGQLYKTDQVKCDTSFHHPQTNHEINGGDHSIFVNQEGTANVVEDDTYCFFIYNPSNGNLPAQAAPVSAKDINSRKLIAEGSAPYLRVKPEIIEKLQDPSKQDYFFTNGRYIVPMPKGKILLPTAGNNIIYNRTTLYRPYFQDVHRQTSNSTASAALLATLENTFPPVKLESGEEKPEFFKIEGTGVRMSGLKHNSSIITRSSPERQGSKLTGWGRPEGAIYMAIGPEEADDKRLNYALHFPSNQAEAEYLSRVSSGDLTVNDNREDGDAGKGLKAPTGENLKKTLREEVLFQYLAGGQYPEGETEAFDPNAITSENQTVFCDDTEVRRGDQTIQHYCGKYEPFYNGLKGLYTDLGVPSDPPVGAEDALTDLLENSPMTSTVVVDGKGFQVSAARVTIGDFENANRSFIDNLDVRVPGGDAANQPYNWTLFMTRERTIGIPMDILNTHLTAAKKSDYKRQSETNFSGGATPENEYFNTKMKAILDTECGGITDVTCIQPKLEALVMNRYAAIEQNDRISGGLKYYTSMDPEGRKLMTRLALFQKLTNQPGGDIKWKPLLPLNVPTCTPLDFSACEALLRGTDVPVLDEDAYRQNRHDPDQLKPVQVGI